MPAKESRGRVSRADAFLQVDKCLVFSNGGFEVRASEPQDWDIVRIYQRLASAGGVMPYPDAEDLMAGFFVAQERLLDRLEKLLKSLPDDSNFPPIFKQSYEHEEGLDWGGPGYSDVPEEDWDEAVEEAWTKFWVSGATFKNIFQASLELDLTPRIDDPHPLYEYREGIWGGLAQFDFDWDLPKNVVRFRLECHRCPCYGDGTTHNCGGLGCKVFYQTSFVPSEFVEEAAYVVENFLQAHYAKHSWPSTKLDWS